MSTAPVAWPTFLAGFRWAQGEHVSLIGHTGSGKTTLARQLLPLRRNVLVLATKPKDPAFDRFARQGYAVTRRWPPAPWRAPRRRYVVRPELTGLDDVTGAAALLHSTLDHAFRDGSWCIYVDELPYACKRLGLAADLVTIWEQGRALGLSLVTATQRPAHVPLEAYSAASHLFLWRETDGSNLKRFRELGGGLGPAVVAALPTLRGHEVLYVNTRTGDIARTLPPR